MKKGVSSQSQPLLLSLNELSKLAKDTFDEPELAALAAHYREQDAILSQAWWECHQRGEGNSDLSEILWHMMHRYRYLAREIYGALDEGRFDHLLTGWMQHIWAGRRQLAPDWAEGAKPASIWSERQSLVLYLRSYRAVIQSLCQRGSETIYLDKTRISIASSPGNTLVEHFVSLYHTLNHILAEEPLYENPKMGERLQGRFKQAIPNGWYVTSEIDEPRSWTILVDPTHRNTFYHYELSTVLSESQLARILQLCH